MSRRLPTAYAAFGRYELSPSLYRYVLCNHPLQHLTRATPPMFDESSGARSPGHVNHRDVRHHQDLISTCTRDLEGKCRCVLTLFRAHFLIIKCKVLSRDPLVCVELQTLRNDAALENRATCWAVLTGTKANRLSWVPNPCLYGGSASH